MPIWTSPGRPRRRTRGDRDTPRQPRRPGGPGTRAGKHCVVDKVMALTTADADRMIAARDRSGCMLSVFHNRRWDWDYLTVKEASRRGIDRPAGPHRELGLPARAATGLARPAPMRPVRSCTTGRHTSSIRPFSSDSGPAGVLPRGSPRAVGTTSTAAATAGSCSSSMTCSFKSNRAAFAGSTAPAGGSSAPREGLSNTESTPRKKPSAPATSTGRPNRQNTRP